MPVRTVLIAHRDPAKRQIVDMLLAGGGYEVVPAADGRSALEALKTHTPVLVIAEAGLRDVDGVELCRKIRRVRRLAAAKVVLVAEPSGPLSVETLRAEAQAVGVDLLLPEPLGDKNLRERVEELFAGEPGGGHPAPAGAATPSRPVEASGPLGTEGWGPGTSGGAGGLARLRERVAELEARSARLEEELQGALVAASEARERLDAAERHSEELSETNERLLEALEAEKRRGVGRGLFNRKRS